jgi:hypothetical protein
MNSTSVKQQITRVVIDTPAVALMLFGILTLRAFTFD